MKKIKVIIAVLILSHSAMAQIQYKKMPSLGISLFFNDYKTAADIRSLGLNEVLNQKQYFKLDRMSPGLAVHYSEGITDHIDWMASVGLSFPSYEVPGRGVKKGNALMEGSVVGNFKLVSDKHFFVPYLTAGAGASKFGTYVSAFMPLGAGFQFKLDQNLFLLLGSQYRVPLTERAAYHFYHHLGVVTAIAEKKKPVVMQPMPPAEPVFSDRDKDGVPDEKDACPDAAGISALKGCPDKDGDGIADREDKCPELSGLARYQGCPVPDMDTDGINDELDKCPAEKGLARYQGCPVPDTDKDGVNDEQDKCPDVAGDVDNNGCPKLESIKFTEGKKIYSFSAKDVQFKLGSAELTRDAKSELDNLVKLLELQSKLGVNISGHTDNSGVESVNQALSTKRAEAVKAYMVKAGISEERLSAVGYGSSKPLVENNSPANKAKNRRVEFSARQ